MVNYWLQRRRARIVYEFIFDGYVSTVDIEKSLTYPSTLLVTFNSPITYAYLVNAFPINPWATGRNAMIKIVSLPDTEIETWVLENVVFGKLGYPHFLGHTFNSLFVACTNADAISSRYFAF